MIYYGIFAIVLAYRGPSPRYSWRSDDNDIGGEFQRWTMWFGGVYVCARFVLVVMLVGCVLTTVISWQLVKVVIVLFANFLANKLGNVPLR
jgi:hypothetical protein